MLWVVPRCSWLFYDIVSESFQLVFSCFNFLNVISSCSKCLMFGIAMVCSRSFYVVFGGFRLVLGGVRCFSVT